MIAPSLWIDPRNGNPYYLAVQYPEKQVQNMADLRSIPLRGPASTSPRDSTWSAASSELKVPRKSIITRSDERWMCSCGRSERT